MYVMTREKNEGDVVKESFITSPRFDIDEVRRVKAMIRFKADNIKINDCEDGVECALYTIMKYGRCISISTISGALYQMRLRVAGKENDFMYVITPIYKDDKVSVTIEKAYKINKDTVNI